jgi:hypothetical protein
MPRPRNERQALEDERDVELPAQLAQYRRNLDAIPTTDKTWQEFVEWQIRCVEKRIADVCARLARGVGREADAVSDDLPVVSWGFIALSVDRRCSCGALRWFRSRTHSACSCEIRRKRPRDVPVRPSASIRGRRRPARCYSSPVSRSWWSRESPDGRGGGGRPEGTASRGRLIPFGRRAERLRRHPSV